MSGLDFDRISDGRASRPMGGYRIGGPAPPTGLAESDVLLRELESLDRRVAQLEAIYDRLNQVTMRFTRLYRRLGHMLLRGPFAGAVQRWMGSLAPQEQYRRWLALHRAADPYSSLGAAPKTPDGFSPRISVIVPVFQPNLSWMESAIDSIRAQTYPHWEILVVLDGPPGEAVLSYCRSLIRDESRAQTILGERGGISSAINLGLNAASGLYTAFLDQDDTLERSALDHIAAVLGGDDPDLLYTDEDYVDQEGRAQLPVFKPGWSPALLLSCMYLSHLLVVRTERAREAGGFRSLRDGAQDYDLVLRLTDTPCKVAHIPFVLYHRRQHAGSTALKASSKPYTQNAGREALAEALARRKIGAEVYDRPPANTYGWADKNLRADEVSIVIPTRNPALLQRLLGSIAATRDGRGARIRVILHCSKRRANEAIAKVARRFGAEITPFAGPFNFSAMNNLAASQTTGALILFLNDDIVARAEGWLNGLCAPFLRPEVGIVGADLRYFDGTIQHSGIVLGIGDGVGHAGRFQLGSPFWPWLGVTRNVSAVTGACLAIRRTLFEQLGGFDTRLPDNYNDVDLCLRAQQAGFEIVLSSASLLHHEEGRTRKMKTRLTERIALWTRWGKTLGEPDHYYSPHLSRRFEKIELSADSPATDGMRQPVSEPAGSLEKGVKHVDPTVRPELPNR
jgi:GT2 family glycosyltransferase